MKSHLTDYRGARFNVSVQANHDSTVASPQGPASRDSAPSAPRAGPSSHRPAHADFLTGSTDANRDDSRAPRFAQPRAIQTGLLTLAPLAELTAWVGIGSCSSANGGKLPGHVAITPLNAKRDQEMATSLVTGAAGFIGSHVANELLAMGHRVVVLDDLSGGVRSNVPAHAQFVEGSILDHALVDRLFLEHRFRYVYHLAAYAAEGLSHFIKRFNYNNNLIGSVNLINAAVNSGTVDCFVFTSSIAVYGPHQIPMSEELTPHPIDPYGIAKLAVELDLREAAEMFGLRFVIFRPHNVYGERQNIGDRYRNVIGIFMNQLLRGDPLTVFGDGQQTRAFTYIADVAPVIARCVERPDATNGVFNIGADVPYTIETLASSVARAMNRPLRIRYLPARNEVVHAYSDHEKVRSVFGDLFRNVSLEEGLARMAAWVEEIGARESQRFAHIEVAKNLPSSWV